MKLHVFLTEVQYMCQNMAVMCVMCVYESEQCEAGNNYL